MKIPILSSYFKDKILIQEDVVKYKNSEYHMHSSYKEYNSRKPCK